MHNGPNIAPGAGRNKAKCEMYRKLKRRERSHIRRIEKHLAVYGRDDKQALDALERYRGLMKGVEPTRPSE